MVSRNRPGPALTRHTLWQEDQLIKKTQICMINGMKEKAYYGAASASSLGEGVIQEGFLEEEALLDLGRVGDNWAKKGRSRLSIC